MQKCAISVDHRRRMLRKIIHHRAVVLLLVVGLMGRVMEPWWSHDGDCNYLLNGSAVPRRTICARL